MKVLISVSFDGVTPPLEVAMPSSPRRPTSLQGHALGVQITWQHVKVRVQALGYRSLGFTSGVEQSQLMYLDFKHLAGFSIEECRVNACSQLATRSDLGTQTWRPRSNVRWEDMIGKGKFAVQWPSSFPFECDIACVDSNMPCSDHILIAWVSALAVEDVATEWLCSAQKSSHLC
eukprot:4642665-Amphidinium_carterae.1